MRSDPPFGPDFVIVAPEFRCNRMMGKWSGTTIFTSVTKLY